ncbi:MAG: hypothetical protein ABS95_02615 [Verrucomicrobia bacterium SCN 57-15]|nr:MAG: hypothetical protein ABS95_02615 [Verrucomicrobia bacterium SCN 57-15]
MKQQLYSALAAVLALGLSGCAHPSQNDLRGGTGGPISPPSASVSSIATMPSDSRFPEWNTSQSDQQLTNQVTLETLTSVALTRNPELRIFEAEIAAAEGAVITARTWDNPELSAAHRIARSLDPSEVDALHGQIGLQQTILFPGKRLLMRAVAQKDVQTRQMALAGFRSQLAIQVRRAYYTLLAAQQTLPLQEQRLTLAKTFVEAAKRKVEAGIAPDFDVTKAEVEVVNAQTALRLAGAGISAAKTELNLLMGRKPDSPLLVGGTLSGIVRLPERENLYEQTLALNPTVKIQEVEIERTGLNLRLVRKSRYPDFTVGPGFETEPGLQVFSFGLSIPLPLWDKKQGPIAVASAEQERALGELDRLRQEILGRVTVASQNLAAVREALTSYTPDFFGRLKAALDTASQSYAEGRTPLLFFLETQRTFFETQASYFETLRRLYESQAELESAIGVPLEELSKPYAK